MPDVGELRQISQGTIHIASVDSGTVRPAAVAIAHVDFPAEPYTGAYEFTPSGEAQTVEIEGKVAGQNITINPIPSNYGRIIWDGNTLMVV